MGTAMRELRTAVMVLLEVSWQDTNGISHTVPARMEDRSASGACIRIKAPIAVGQQVVVRSRAEEFSGICKYCRSEEWEYIIGIHRDTSKPSEPKGAFGRGPQSSEGSATRNSTFVASKMLPGLKAQENQQIRIIPSVQEKLGSDSGLHAVKDQKDQVDAVTPLRPTELSPPVTTGSGHGIDSRESSRISRHEQFAIRRRARLRTKEAAKGKEVRRERKPMGRNWLERAPWSSKQGSADAAASHNDNGNGSSASTGVTMNMNTKESVGAPRSMPKSSFDVDNTAGFEIDLLPMEEIYRAAGVVSPQKGYSVHKVVDMLHSEHIRGLSTDLKRAAVLMALDAAGVTVEQIQQDANSRQDALERYETEQAKQADAEWARRAKENEQIQAELERVKAHYMARINRNLDGVTREKSKFNDWLALKKQESERMSEAVTLCGKSAVKAAVPLAIAAAAGDSAKVP